MQAFGGAKLILFLGDRIVVLRRDDRPDIPWPGRLDLPGGGREGDETAEACVLRETLEEVGLALCPEDLIWRGRHKRGVFFAAHLPCEMERRIVFGSEGQGWMLMAADRYVEHPEAIPHFAQMVRRYLDQLLLG
ncbi:MAG: NUDIX hydrolase [Marivita sp.]|uniref:NUDIX hydrolase n=1 Tax=Marivita sp. TaxID=2003365 RepID=UPI0025C4F873|nr:NUDIX hydrolase [Marivita sp.]MCI5111301.1 NUDIX hydrolase [Marivita sp.]